VRVRTFVIVLFCRITPKASTYYKILPSQKAIGITFWDRAT
jgi:hypothetical protein